ncbi:MAG TPA: NAD(P)/FAD-dependent oxidoreductase [Verrucomicrobiae bacterium]|nr:NAD(P)/FAD-dependent oxidoreductase [Verrucomicrobiae bacterium]
MQADVVVVGAGPAGLATATAASLRGLRVVVIDSRRPLIDKPCGEGLLPEAVAGLRAIGVELDSTLAFPFTGIRFSDRTSSVSAKFARGEAFGLRRTTLHQLLVNRAREVGIEFRWGARISGLEDRGVRVGREFISSQWLVGADGQNSMVRKWAKLGPRRPVQPRFGFRRHYRIAPWTDLVEVYWDERFQLFITPTEAQEICLALISSDPHLRIDRALARVPEVAGRLRDAPPTSAESGAVTALVRARAVVRNHVALVGDASCTVDGIAGLGLSLALQQAGHLAEALARGDLARYASAHRQVTKVAVGMTRLLLLLDRSAWLRRKALRLFANKPALFSQMISIHTGKPAPEALNAREIFDLGWRVLWA